MPRILTPRNSFPRRPSNASLSGSKSSMRSIGGSVTAQRRPSGGSNYHGSQFSLTRRTSMRQNGSAQSSTHSLLRPSAQPASKQNAEWNIQDQDKVSQGRPLSLAGWNIGGQGKVSPGGPPSLATSVTSEETESSSLSSLQSGLQSPSILPPLGNSRQDAMQRYYTLRRASLQQQTSSEMGPPKNHAFRRASLQHPSILHATSITSAGSANSFLPCAGIKEEDGWGQFVDVADAEKELIRRSKLLAISRRYHATTGRPGPVRSR